MLSFMEVYEDTVRRLGRQLYDDEMQFLKWVYSRYEEEQHHLNMKYRKI